MSDFPELDTWLKSQHGRCSGCGHHLTKQVCACAALAAKAAGMAVAIAAAPDDAARVETAIRQLAVKGEPFSANDARDIHGVRGGVVGATFNALRAAKVIRPIGDETSTDKGTHGKSVTLWIRAAA